MRPVAGAGELEVSTLPLDSESGDRGRLESETDIAVAGRGGPVVAALSTVPIACNNMDLRP